MVVLTRVVALAHAASSKVPVLRRADGTAVPIPDNGGVVTVGSAPNAMIQVKHDRILQEHCTIRLKSGRVFCRCDATDTLQDDDLGAGLIPADTHVYIKGSQLRQGVDYMVPPDSRIYFGEDNGVEYVIAEFEENAGNGQEVQISEMLMKGMASQGNKKVQDVINDTFQ